MRSLSRDTWAVVLAAGEGRRIQAFTRDEQGVSVPKQYCTFGRATCMLEWALERAHRVVSPARTLAVVASEHLAHFEPIVERTGFEAIVQPRNRGTAAGVLLPLLHVLERQPDAVVLVLPSDHDVRHESLLERSLETALEAAREDERLVLLGMTPEGPDTDYGWIVPEPGAETLGPVLRFAEKPSAPEALRLHENGALWNSFIMAGRARTFVHLVGRALPGLLRDLRVAFERGDRALAAAYENLVARDFSRDVLAASADRLRVLRVPECGWSDLGTPARLERFLGAPSRAIA
jgi:mannose-1-phosphate guanylyltransferase